MTALAQYFDYKVKFTLVLSGHCTLSTDEIFGLGLLRQVDEGTFKTTPVIARQTAASYYVVKIFAVNNG